MNLKDGHLGRKGSERKKETCTWVQIWGFSVLGGGEQQCIGRVEGNMSLSKIQNKTSTCYINMLLKHRGAYIFDKSLVILPDILIYAS